MCTGKGVGVQLTNDALGRPPMNTKLALGARANVDQVCGARSDGHILPILVLLHKVWEKYRVGVGQMLVSSPDPTHTERVW